VRFIAEKTVVQKKLRLVQLREDKHEMDANDWKEISSILLPTLKAGQIDFGDDRTFALG
jgi:hypothetical protein